LKDDVTLPSDWNIDDDDALSLCTVLMFGVVLNDAVASNF